MRIFINYRRVDTLTATGRIDDHLRHEFGEDAVFRDVDNIPLGVDFVEHIDQAVGSTSVMLTVIGKHWVTDKLHAEHDFIRLEIEAALKRNIPIIPVLVEGATMPTPDQVPPSLRPLLRRNGLHLDFGRDFRTHVARLVDGIKRLPAFAVSQAPSRIITDNGGVELLRLDGGTFKMGSPNSEEGRFDDEGPQHDVTISAFWIGRYPVTNAQYKQFLQANPTARKPDGWVDSGPGDEPVVNVSWDEASAFAKWAGGRLPTEAEWEYAARAGTVGSRYGAPDEIAWYAENSGRREQPVGKLKPNAWGLYDMLGNVWEWCSDRFGPYSAEAVTDPSGPTVGSKRVLRGGSWSNDARYVRAADRVRYAPSFRDGNIGFRLARGQSGSSQ